MIRRTQLLTLTLLAAFLVAVPRPAPAEAQAPPSALSGVLPAGGGVGLGVWNGGSLTQLRDAADAKGCALDAAWVTPGGRFVGYVFGAPPVVNAAFLAEYPGPIGAGTPMILVCRVPQPATPAVVGLPGDPADRALERLIYDGLNAERTTRGLSRLAGSGILNTTAIKYAAFHWAKGLPLNHEADGNEPWDRARAEGYPSFNVGEVLAAQQRSDNLTVAQLAPRFVQQWMDSPPHRAIVLGEALDASELGVGCAHGKDREALYFTLFLGMTGRP
ncbi:MAG: CAP domain-containing protein [Chloroflexi bacterium]|nr:MAG: CAP domain-containing protein [Chloroflexota bacterium]